MALLDIERLRSVNESLGRRAGDALLRQVAQRLTQAAGAGAVARIALDHFVVVMPTIKDQADAERMIAAIARACFAEPYAVEGTELKVGARRGWQYFRMTASTRKPCSQF